MTSRPETLRRAGLYGAASLVVAGLLTLGFGTQGEPDVETLLNGADALTLVGAHDKAIVECLKVLERDPGNLRAHLLLALGRDRSGDLVEAAETYRRALPHAEDAAMGLEIELATADCLRRAGRAQDALDACERIERERGTTDARLSAVRGLAHASLGNQERAVESLAVAVSRDPGDASFREFLERARAGDRFEPVPPSDSTGRSRTEGPGGT
jgi:tetratricopeptide (TPR) repeat protein